MTPARAPSPAPTLAGDGRSGPEDRLALASAGLALALALGTAARLMPLHLNPHVALSAAFDAAIVLYLTVALTILQRRRRLGAFLALLIANGALAASCAKIMVLGEPGLFGDLLLVPDLLRVIDPHLAWTGIAILAALAIAYGVNLGSPRTARESLLLLPLGGAVLFMAGVSLAPSLAHAAVGGTPVPGRSFPVFGHFFTAYANLVRDADWRHTIEGLRREGELEPPVPPLSARDLRALEPRNLHILVLESFTDPAWYPGFGLDDLSLPPTFERWRAESGSTALSPVFGNRSSNAEFEVLCGVPAAAGPSDVIFWRLPERALPCLPNLLAAHGYRSTALHPSPQRTFNLSKAYPALGFADSAFLTDLDATDRDGAFLSADSTLEQHWARIRALLAGAAPVLSYAFINASHFPYDRDEARRPTRWRPPSASTQVVAYLNAIHHLLVAVDRFVARLLADDPESLILIVGDHAPALGADFAGQRDGGLIARDEPDPLGRAAMHEVPLIMLDRGVLASLGRLPTYLIPHALLDRLSPGDGAGAWDTSWRLRPFRDRAILVEAAGPGERLCSVAQPADGCAEAADQVRAWQLELLELIEAPPAETS